MTQITLDLLTINLLKGYYATKDARELINYSTKDNIEKMSSYFLGQLNALETIYFYIHNKEIPESIEEHIKWT